MTAGEILTADRIAQAVAGSGDGHPLGGDPAVERAGGSSAGEPGAPVLRVIATDAAVALIDTLRAKHGPLMFHQSGGCCDGSAPMCYPLGEFVVGDYDRLLGHIGGAPFYISGPQFEYWQHTQLNIDVVPGRGGMFSLEGPEGLRFLVRSRLFTDEEAAALEAQGEPQAGACDPA